MLSGISEICGPITASHGGWTPGNRPAGPPPSLIPASHQPRRFSFLVAHQPHSERYQAGLPVPARKKSSAPLQASAAGLFAGTGTNGSNTYETSSPRQGPRKMNAEPSGDRSTLGRRYPTRGENSGGGLCYGEVTTMACLYRHFDRHGVLLYVGISLNPIARLAQHIESSHWSNSIASIAIERHESIVGAAAAEKAAIRAEHPLHNKALREPEPPCQLFSSDILDDKAAVAEWAVNGDGTFSGFVQSLMDRA